MDSLVGAESREREGCGVVQDKQSLVSAPGPDHHLVVPPPSEKRTAIKLHSLTLSPPPLPLHTFRYRRRGVGFERSVEYVSILRLHFVKMRGSGRNSCHSTFHIFVNRSRRRAGKETSSKHSGIKDNPPIKTAILVSYTQ